MRVEFSLELEPRRQQRVRHRYASEIAELTAIGFRELCFYRELLGRFSILRSLPIVALMASRREILSIRSPLQACASFLLLVRDDPTTVALPMGFGVKYYTAMRDGIILISTSFESAPARFDDRLLKYSADGESGLTETWGQHQDRVREFVERGQEIRRDVDYSVFVSIAQREQSAIFDAPQPATAKAAE